jgi:L-lactate dehydrogenase complex protein LldG
MSSARDRIFARIAEARGGAQLSASAIAAERAALLPDESITQPTIGEQDTIARFKTMASSERLTASVDEVSTLEGVPAAVAAYLARTGLPGEVAIAPALAGLDWGSVQASTDIGANQPVAVTLADGGVAETGSLIFRSGPGTPMLHNFLALHHVAVVERSKISRFLESVFAPDTPALPRILSLVTGTSGTADIEAVNIRGAHGPRYLHIVLVG